MNPLTIFVPKLCLGARLSSKLCFAAEATELPGQELLHSIFASRASYAIFILLWPTVAAQASPQQPAARTLLDYNLELRTARLKGDLETWRAAGAEALKLTPDNPDFLISVSRANAGLGRNDEALRLLDEAVQRGAGLEPDRFPEYEGMKQEQRFLQIVKRAKANMAPLPRAKTFALLPTASEGIAYDSVSRRLFAGTEGGILQVDADGKVSTFVSGNGLRQVLGIKVDAERRLLWAVSGRFPDVAPGPTAPPADVGTGGVHVYHLDRAERIGAYEIDERPVLHGFNDIALARDGTVYVTDSTQGAIYRLGAGATQLERWLQDSRMTFPNGIVLSPDDKRLYVAHVEGVSMIDTASRAKKLLTLPANAAVHNMDGLAWYKGSLLGVHASPYFRRIVRVHLADNGAAIDKVSVVNARTPDYHQTTAAVAGDKLYVVGGSPLPNLYGGPPATEPKPQILQIPLP
jgi:DNA-binding beta-propeller fold protein YncE